MQKQILQDVSSTGKVRPWREHKIANELLAKAYDDVNPRKAERLRECGTKLSFEEQENGKLKLVGMWNCRVRLCPLCSWRRSLKVAAQMTQVIAAMQQEKEHAFVLLTLTIRNCEGEELDETITQLMSGFKRLLELKEVGAICEGWYRSLEVTHNVEADTYHPHFHVLLAVKPGYFSGGRYIKQEIWAKLWQESMRLDYTPVVDVRRVRGDTSGAIAEVAKYSVKPGDYLLPDDWSMTLKSVRLLDKALDKRRLIAYGGKFKLLHKRLHLDNEETGDLINVDGQAPERPQGRVIHFLWYSGYRQYQKDERPH